MLHPFPVSTRIIDSRSTVFDAALDAIVTIDHEGRIVELLASAASLEACAPDLLGTLADAFDAAFAAVWIVDGDVLRCLATHHTNALADDSFGALSRAMTFVAGVGVPGRIWRTVEP